MARRKKFEDKYAESKRKNLFICTNCKSAVAGALALGRRKCQEEEADIKEEEKDWMYGLKTKNLSEKRKSVLDVHPQWRVSSPWANATAGPSLPTLDNALHCSVMQYKTQIQIQTQIHIHIQTQIQNTNATAGPSLPTLDNALHCSVMQYKIQIQIQTQTQIHIHIQIQIQNTSSTANTR